MQTRNKGISIVFIPVRGKTRTFEISSLVSYLLLVSLFAVIFFSYQFFSNLHQIKLNYLALSSFSEEEKQELLSEELSVIQEELSEIQKIHDKNKQLTSGISTSDQDIRKKLGLRENKYQYTVNTKNQRFTPANLTLSPASIFELKEMITKQNLSLNQRTRNLVIYSMAVNDFKAEQNKMPYGYPYGNKYSISPGFGWRRHPIYGTPDYHTGVDISVPYGYGLKATGDGRVVEAGWSGGYGYMIKIYHRNGIESLYAHCSELLVDVGDVVRRGDIIAKAGHSGAATESHVHYEIIYNNEKVNPEKVNEAIEKARSK